MSSTDVHMAEACRLARLRGQLRAVADILPALLEQVGHPDGLGPNLSAHLVELDGDLAARVADHRIQAAAESFGAFQLVALEQAARRPLPPMYVEPSKPATIDRAMGLRALGDLEHAHEPGECLCGLCSQARSKGNHPVHAVPTLRSSFERSDGAMGTRDHGTHTEAARWDTASGLADGELAWTYDPVTNTVTFHGAASGPDVIQAPTRARHPIHGIVRGREACECGIRAWRWVVIDDERCLVCVGCDHAPDGRHFPTRVTFTLEGGSL